jgi:hypothetical protein
MVFIRAFLINDSPSRNFKGFLRSLLHSAERFCVTTGLNSAASWKGVWLRRRIATLISLEVPPRRSGSPFKGIQGNQGEANFVVFYGKNWDLLLRRSTFNRSTFKEVRVKCHRDHNRPHLLAFSTPLKDPLEALKRPFKGLSKVRPFTYFEGF